MREIILSAFILRQYLSGIAYVLGTVLFTCYYLIKLSPKIPIKTNISILSLWKLRTRKLPQLAYHHPLSKFGTFFGYTIFLIICAMTLLN